MLVFQLELDLEVKLDFNLELDMVLELGLMLRRSFARGVGVEHGAL